MNFTIGLPSACYDSCASPEASFEQADQPAVQGSNSMDDVLNLAQVKAELSHLQRLDERREINVASLKRLKEARDALLWKEYEVSGNEPGSAVLLQSQ
jgi:hypothetical protein